MGARQFQFEIIVIDLLNQNILSSLTLSWISLQLDLSLLGIKC